MKEDGGAVKVVEQVDSRALEGHFSSSPDFIGYKRAVAVQRNYSQTNLRS